MATVTMPYGRKGHLWRAGYHTGTDYAYTRNAPIPARAGGRVIHVGRTGGWGQAYGVHVIVQDLDGNRWLYAHLTKAEVKEREAIAKGDTIGLAGATGNAFGVHLHLEVREAPYRYAVDTLDPEKVLAPKPKKKVPNADK